MVAPRYQHLDLEIRPYSFVLSIPRPDFVMTGSGVGSRDGGEG